MKSSMKNIFLSSYRYVLAAGGLFLGLAFLLCASASAQELLKNGDFESPIPGLDPTDNWTLVYVDGGPADFSIAGRTTEASYCCGGRGAHLRGNNPHFAHAYFKQVVTNLTEGASYTLNILKMRAGFKYADEGPSPKLKVYASMISGSSSNAVHGYSTNIGPYSLTITAAATRQIEVQLHMWHGVLPAEVSEDYKTSKTSGWFDRLSLTLAP
jgi:hypothetical protein